MSQKSHFSFDYYHLNAGVVSGVIAGIVFGSVLAMSGDVLLPVIAKIFGVDTAIGAFVLHLGFSIFLGIIFALVLGRAAMGTKSAAILGIAYGVFWWVLASLIVQPMLAGKAPLTFDLVDQKLHLLWGYIVYGFTLGQIYPTVVERVRVMRGQRR